MKPLVFLILFSAAMGSAGAGSQPFEKDRIETSGGDLEITFIGHGTLMLAFEKKGIPMENGDEKTVCGLTIEAIPAYNLVHKRDSGEPFHPKGNGNGYLITFGNKRVYVAGDTENTPEMKALKDIDVAFLPMNLPYTMTPEMVADAAKTFRPKILYPYHFSDTDPNRLVKLMKDAGEIEVRIRRMR